MNYQQIKPLRETGKHSYHRRAFAHDYYAPFIYHIILKKARGCEAFGTIDGDARIAPGKPGCARIKENGLGKIIAKTILHFPYEFPIIKILQFCVMPDHVHILLQILYRSDKHLDFYIDTLEKLIASKSGKSLEDIFEEGYCDKPLYDNRSLDGLFRYIRENPHRLAMRRQYPQFFQRARNIQIGERQYEAYGNLFLLRNPDKEAVKISRKDSPEAIAEKTERWLDEASRGTVLVSPFISPREKEIRAKAEAQDASIILVTHEAFPERFKPSEHDFTLCSAGRLLFLSLGLPAKTPLDRSTCLAMNALAAEIATC